MGKVETKNGKRGQVWSLDFFISLLLFILTISLAAMILKEHLGQESRSFEKFLLEAETTADKLMSEGYPKYWSSEDVIRAGLLTSDRLSPRKTKEFKNLTYQDSKTLLGITSDYYISFKDENNSLLNIRGDCYIGSDKVAVEKETYTELSKLGYYYRSGNSDYLKQEAESLEGDMFSDEDVSSMLNKPRLYDVFLLENPEFSSLETSSKLIKSSLQSFSEQGGSLFVVGNTSMELLGVNLKKADESGGEVVQAVPELNLEKGDSFNFSSKPLYPTPVNDTLINHFTHVGNTSSGLPVMAYWTYGDGEVYYFGGVTGDYADGTLEEKLEGSVDALVNVTVANCSSLRITGDYDNRVSVERVVIKESDTAFLNLVFWE